MKTNLETLKKEALQTLELSPRTKESVVNADLQKVTTAIKTLTIFGDFSGPEERITLAF